MWLEDLQGGLGGTSTLAWEESGLGRQGARELRLPQVFVHRPVAENCWVLGHQATQPEWEIYKRVYLPPATYARQMASLHSR